MDISELTHKIMLLLLALSIVLIEIGMLLYLWTFAYLAGTSGMMFMCGISLLTTMASMFAIKTIIEEIFDL